MFIIPSVWFKRTKEEMRLENLETAHALEKFDISMRNVDIKEIIRKLEIHTTVTIEYPRIKDDRSNNRK